MVLISLEPLENFKKSIYFLKQQSTQDAVSYYLNEKKITWKFIPQHAPHFGGIWEAAVKSLQCHEDSSEVDTI